MKEVKSPWNTSGNEPMRGYSPGSRSNPSNPRQRADGHVAGHLGKSGSQPASATRDRPPDSNRVIEPVKDRR